MMQQFMQHIADHGHSYGTIEEFNFRANIFAEVDAEIESINRASGKAGESLRVGHNHMSTWTKDEKKRMLGFVDVPTATDAEYYEPSENEVFADEVNWVTQGAVTEVKDQGGCGSCWSFSVTGAVEGSYKINGNPLTAFSEEELVQCNTMNHGCHGGNMSLAFGWLMLHSLNTEAAYPYTSGKGVRGACNKSLAKGPVKVKSFKPVIPMMPSHLKSAISQQPVSVAVAASKTVFGHYKTGVITGSACGKLLDHGVLAVGYGTEGGVPYFLVKNSWTANWGDKGYVKIGIESGAGVCGINMTPHVPHAVAV